MDKDLINLQAEIETAIFEYERKTGLVIREIDIRRVGELDFNFAFETVHHVDIAMGEMEWKNTDARGLLPSSKMGDEGKL